MKKKSFLLSALAVLGVAMASCTPEQQPEQQGDGTPSAGTVIEKTFEAVTSDLQSENADVSIEKLETKSTVSGNKILWAEGDEISVFALDNKKNNKFISDMAGETASFSGKVLDAETYYAIYPYKPLYLYRNGAVSNIDIPAEQVAIEGSFAPKANIAFASATAGSEQLAFKSLGSIIRFSFDGDVEHLYRVVVSDKNGADVAGKFEIKDVTAPALTAVNAAPVTAITLHTPEGGYKKGVTYYACVAPGAFAEGCILTLTDDRGRGCVVTGKPSTSFEAGEVLDFKTVEIPVLNPELPKVAASLVEENDRLYAKVAVPTGAKQIMASFTIGEGDSMKTGNVMVDLAAGQDTVMISGKYGHRSVAGLDMNTVQKVTLEMRMLAADGTPTHQTGSLVYRSHFAHDEFITDGSAEHPFEIKSAKHLKDAHVAPAAHFVLLADIDMNKADMIGIGSGKGNFKGTFDGKGHVIKNVNLVKAPGDGAMALGFFNNISSEGVVVKDFTLENITATAPEESRIAAVAGVVDCDAVRIENVNVINCVFTGKEVAGIVAHMGETKTAGEVIIKNCHVSGGKLTAIANGCAGGIVGWMKRGSLLGCSAALDIEGKGSVVGGLVGIGHAGGKNADYKKYNTIAGSYAKCNIKNSKPDAGGLSGIYCGTMDGTYTVSSIDCANASFDNTVCFVMWFRVKDPVTAMLPNNLQACYCPIDTTKPGKSVYIVKWKRANKDGAQLGGELDQFLPYMQPDMMKEMSKPIDQSVVDKMNARLAELPAGAEFDDINQYHYELVENHPDGFPAVLVKNK